MGRIVKSIEEPGSPLEKITETQYTISGEKKRITLPDGTSLHYEYDSLDRLSHLYSSDGSIDYSYSYDIFDRVIEERDNVHSLTTKRLFDVDGRVILEELGNGLKVAYAYDFLDRVTGIRLPDQSSVDYQYDAAFLCQVSKRKDEETLYSHTFSTYNLAGQPTQEKLADNNTQIRSHYDASGKLVRIESLPLTERIHYDASGNPTLRELRDPSGCISSNYTYDSLDQLTSESGPIQHNYSYDALHNRLEDEWWQ